MSSGEYLCDFLFMASVERVCATSSPRARCQAPSCISATFGIAPSIWVIRTIWATVRAPGLISAALARAVRRARTAWPTSTRCFVRASYWNSPT
jgi:hypothetical protein